MTAASKGYHPWPHKQLLKNEWFSYDFLAHSKVVERCLEQSPSFRA